MSKKENPFSTDLNDLMKKQEFADWMKQWGKWILASILTLLIILVVLFRINQGAKERARGDLLSLPALFFTFQNEARANQFNEQTFEQLNLMLKNHPELKPLYQGIIAQTLLLAQKEGEAEKEMKDIFHRTKQDELEAFRTFSKISLLIAKLQLEEALEMSIALQREMDPSLHNLETFNLYRVFRLQTLLNKNEDALQTKELLLSKVDQDPLRNQWIDKMDGGSGHFIDHFRKL